MNKSDQRIRKFNPGTFQFDEEVKEQFVVRERELDIVLEVLRGNIDSPSCQHVLVVAPRGRGKTMLLTRIAAELNTTHELSECLLPVRFMEESHEIFSLADFWLDTLFYLARESTKHDPTLAGDLRETHADLTTRWQEEALADRGRAAVLEAAARLGKKLVLMVENLQALCGNVDKNFGWELRGALQSEPQIMLLATATSRFKSLDDAEQPFFELFRIVSLEPLATEECRRLWQVVSGDAVSQREIRPLEILTGGSPRLIVIVAEFARHRSLRQLMEELVELIDEHTEYFRGHLEVLAKGERRVYIAVIDLWRQSSTGEIAARARMDVRPVSTLLGRLVERGAVIAKESGKKRLYAAAEPLYSIYYKLRRERDEVAVVANLIHFMTVFYSYTELAEISGKLIAEATRSPTIREGIERAIAEQPQFGRLFPSMARPSIDRISIPAAVTDNESVKQLFEEVTTAFNEGAFEKVIETVDQAFTAQSANWSRVPESLIAWALSKKGNAHEKRGEFEAAIEAYDEVITRFGTSDTPDLQVPVAWALSQRGDVQGQRGEFEAAIEAYDEVITRFGTSDTPDLQVPVAWALSQRGDVQGQRGEFEAAIEAYDEVITRFGTSDTPDLQVPVAWALSQRGDVQRQRGEFEAAIEAYDEVITRFGTSDTPNLQVPVACALCDKGDVQRQRGEFEAAIEAYDEVITRFGTSDTPNLQVPVAWALSKKGDAQRQRGEFEAAIEAYDEVITRFGTSDTPNLQVPVAWALCDKGDVQRQRGEFETAIEAYDEVITRFGTSDTPDLQVPVAWALSDKGGVQGQRGEFEAAIEAYDEVIARFGTSDTPDLQVPVAWALSDKGGVQGQRGEFEAAIEAYDEVITRFGTSDTPNLQVPVVWALFKKGMGQIEMGRAEEALNTCGELELRLGALTENERNEFTWRAMCVRVLALLVQERHQAAMDTFRSAYAVFVPSNKTTLYDMLRIVPELVATGASTRNLVEILSSNKSKSDALVPLIVALRQHTGEEVRAPVEVLEVAADIRERIEARVANGPPVAS